MAKHYDKEFKEDALKYREDNLHLTVTAVCRNLGISVPTFYNWQRSLRKMIAKYYIEVQETSNLMKLKK